MGGLRRNLRGGGNRRVGCCREKTNAEGIGADIGIDGKAHAIRVIQGLGYGLNENAAKCLSEWRYRPGTANGVSVTVPAPIEIFFSLDSK
jgi:hypothetical protein